MRTPVALLTVLLLAGCQAAREPTATVPGASPPAGTAAAATPAAGGSTPAEGVTLPSSGSTDAGPEALATGVLRGDGALGAQGCVWVEMPGSEERISVLWPKGYRARFDPLELLDGDGRVIARDGDLLELTGGAATQVGTGACRVSTVVWAAWQIDVVPRADPPR